MTAMVLLSEWMASQVEFWLPIPKVEGYDVSSLGRIRSWRTIKPRVGGGTDPVRRMTPRIMRPSIPKSGYPIVGIGRLRGEGAPYGRSPAVHRLVAVTFIPNPENKPSVNHLTGLKTDCRVDGLAWATWKEQARHAWAYGLHKRDRFEVAKKLNAGRRDYRDIPDSMVRMIRNMLKDGISQGQIRRWSGLTYATIQSIAVGRTYRDVA